MNLKGKVVKIHYSPATVYWYETNVKPLGNWEGVGSRISHESGNLPIFKSSEGGM